MLHLDQALELHGVTVYRDYNEKSRFYCLPGSPRLAVEAGQPMFQLLVYRDIVEEEDEAKGGGFLAMTADLGISPDTLERIRNELSGRFGVRATLAPVPVTGGSVRVVALDSEADPEAGGVRFVENLIASGKPSLYGDQRAVFSTELSKKGAVLMKAALEGEGATPVVLIYDLQYIGLHPAYGVKITIKFRQVYEHLRNRMQINTLWFKSDIDREMELLRKAGGIEIEEVVYENETPEDTSARMTRLNTLAKELAQWSFFSPAISPGTVLAADRGTLQAYDAIPDIQAITAGLTSGSRAALTGVGARADAGAPRRPGAAVATDAVEGEAGGESEGGGGTNAEEPTARDEPMTAVEAWNRAGRPQGAFLLRSLEQEERHDIVYELHQVAAVERSFAPQGQIRLLEGASGMPGRILQVDLSADFFKTIEGSISTTADLEALGVASVVVKLRYGEKEEGDRWKDEDEAVLSAPGDSHSYRFFIDHRDTREVEYQVTLNYRPDFALGHEAPTETSGWIPTTTRNLDINPLAFSSVLPIHLEAAMVDWDSVQQIQARVHYADSASGIDAADTKILTQQSASADLRIRPKDAAKRDVSLDAVFFYTDGESETVSMRHAGDEPFVLNQPPESMVAVNLRLADILDRYKRINVQLRRSSTAAPEVEQTVTLGEGTLDGQWSFRREGDDGASFAYRVTAFLKDGAVREDDWKTTDNPLVVVGDRAAGVLTVRVMFLGPLADGGFRLAKLKLDYPDAPDWADSNVEQVFRTGQEEFTWRVPMTRTDATSYIYEVTWFGNDGSRRTTGPVTTNEEILLLDPLAP
ncbi:hypothetical protein [Thiocapsa bogorovii]|uniref:hypothetical protein n=1 Tax=Thiocapsa bogorovii TaxID=521689 RepID=UPI001E36BD79|nr:hypothetical protein [Thiocapsa bogorovii]UHD15073.1 hypothetical protein LT988_17540 [Thiocapsa bogorovii]